MANFSPVSAAIGGALIGLSAALLMLLIGRVAGISSMRERHEKSREMVTQDRCKIGAARQAVVFAESEPEMSR
jgi:uncharacterized membrane protein YedE/YeeE